MNQPPTASALRPASTAIVLRDAAGGLETLLVQRSSKLAFHGGAWVFPGGRVEQTDAATEEERFEEIPARTAACREALEEVALHLHPEHLVPFSHWTTPPGRPRRFATWFFLARMPGGEVEVDGGEIESHRWVTPDEALAAHARLELELPPPTFVTLTVLSRFSSVRAAFEAAPESFERFVPRMVPVPGGLVSLYADDAGYATEDLERLGPRHRLYMVGVPYRYVRDPLEDR